MANILEIQNLSKKYPGGVQALDALTLVVAEGSIYGLLGPNGSGKTTTLGIVLDVLRADQGSFNWFGLPLSKETERRIGAILETPNFYPYLSATQNLKIIANIKNTAHQEIEPVLRTVGLFQRRHSAYKEFSLGMKQRLALAAALLGNPQVLVLDEPTNGLDPQGIAEVREIIKQVAGQGKTIILASHLLDEVQKVCTHMAVLQAGKLKIAGRVDAILAQQDQVIIRAENLAAALALLPQLPQVSNFRQDNNSMVLTLANGFTSTDLNQAFFQRGIILSELTVRQKSLEAQFLDIITNTTTNQ
ncbi:MAG: ABC transporter ATP-binding protein [Adhaeribacter sp.]